MKEHVKPVWEEYPGYSELVQLYHSFDLKEEVYGPMSEEETDSVLFHIRLAHMLVLARMDEEDYLDLVRSMQKRPEEEGMNLMQDWRYVCSVFDEEFFEQLKEHRKHAGN